MIDFAKPGRKELIFFEPQDKVRWHTDNGLGPYTPAVVVRTARTRVLIQPEGRAEQWAPNLHLSHNPKFYGRNG